MSTITVTRVCPFCGKFHSMTFDYASYELGMRKREAGALIQDAFPNFTPNEREFIKTGICSTCWDEL